MELDIFLAKGGRVRIPTVPFSVTERFGQEIASAEGCPLRFNLDPSHPTVRIVEEAQPWPVFGLGDQAARNRIAVHVGRFSTRFAPDIEIIVAALPEQNLPTPGCATRLFNP